MSYTPFPIQCLPKPLATFCRAGARVFQCDESFIALPMLTMLGDAIGNSAVAFAGGEWYEPPIIWTAVVGLSGTGKSPSFRYAIRPMLDHQRDVHKTFTEAVAEFQSSRKSWKNTPADDRDAEPEPPRAMEHIYTTNATCEAIAGMLADSKRGLAAAFDEFASLINGLNQYKGKGNDTEAWLSFYDAAPTKIDRRTGEPKTLYIPRAFVACTGGIQPSALRASMNGELVGKGFMARLLFAFPPDRPMGERSRENVPDEVKAAVSEIYGKLRAIPMMDRPKVIPLSDLAGDLFDGFLSWIKSESDGNGDEADRAMLAKLRGVALRLGLILQFASGAADEDGANVAEIDHVSMERAVTLCRWFANEGRRVYRVMAETEESRTRRELLQWVASREGRATIRDLQRGPRRYRADISLAETDLQSLVDDGYGAWQTEKADQGGPAVEVFCMAEHPDFPFTKGGDGDGTLKNSTTSSVVSPSPLQEGQAGDGPDDYEPGVDPVDGMES